MSVIKWISIVVIFVFSINTVQGQKANSIDVAFGVPVEKDNAQDMEDFNIYSRIGYSFKLRETSFYLQPEILYLKSDLKSPRASINFDSESFNVGSRVGIVLHTNERLDVKFFSGVYMSHIKYIRNYGYREKLNLTTMGYSFGLQPTLILNNYLSFFLDVNYLGYATDLKAPEIELIPANIILPIDTQLSFINISLGLSCNL